MAEKRKCFMCGKEYEYCPNCQSGIEKPWKFLFHDEKCLAVSKIWYAYRGKEIDGKEAIKRMNEYPDTIEKILKYDSVPAQEIKVIYGVDKIEDNVVKETEIPVKTIEENVKPEKHDHENKKEFRKNK